MYALLNKMGLIAYITKIAVIPVTVIADAMASTAVIAVMAIHVVFYIRNHFIRKSASKSQKIKKKSKKLGRLRYKYP